MKKRVIRFIALSITFCMLVMSCQMGTYAATKSQYRDYDLDEYDDDYDYDYSLDDDEDYNWDDDDYDLDDDDLEEDDVDDYSYDYSNDKYSSSYKSLSRIGKKNKSVSLRYYYTLKCKGYINTAKSSNSNLVRIYDRERCICDIIKNKNKMDIQIFQMSVTSYFSDGDKNIHNLMEYAQIMGISDKVRQYTEVLL